MKKTGYPFIIGSFLFLMSCTYGYHARVSYTPLFRDMDYTQLDTSFRAPDSIELYFEGSKPVRAFVELGYIESVAGQYSNTDEVLKAMKAKASVLRAHAIVNIRRSNQTETSGFLLDSKSEEKFQAAVFSGVAVRYLK